MSDALALARQARRLSDLAFAASEAGEIARSRSEARRLISEAGAR
jgi:hypothetical protein